MLKTKTRCQRNALFELAAQEQARLKIHFDRETQVRTIKPSEKKLKQKVGGGGTGTGRKKQKTQRKTQRLKLNKGK